MCKVRRLIVSSLLVLVVCAFASAAEFESCRCRDGLASRGDSKDEVLKECGKPVRKESKYKTVRGSRIYVEEWIYNFGPDEFMQAINFDRSGMVISVDSLGYGS